MTPPCVSDRLRHLLALALLVVAAPGLGAQTQRVNTTLGIQYPLSTLPATTLVDSGVPLVTRVAGRTVTAVSRPAALGSGAWTLFAELLVPATSRTTARLSTDLTSGALSLSASAPIVAVYSSPQGCVSPCRVTVTWQFTSTGGSVEPLPPPVRFSVRPGTTVVRPGAP